MKVEKTTEILATPKKPNQNRYHFAAMLEYARKHNKNIEELTIAEKRMFIVNEKDDKK